MKPLDSVDSGEVKKPPVILIVDDEEPLREVGEMMLAREGYEVVQAASGEEAVMVYEQRGDIELVVLDLSMPGMGGEECLRTIGRLDPTAKVILTSGHQPRGDLAAEYGPVVKGYMNKPFKRADLVSVVAEVLGGQAGSA